MKEAIEAHLRQVEDFVPADATALEAFRVAYLGKKGHVTGYFTAFKSVPNEEKKEFGQWVNSLKQAVEAKIDAYREQFSAAPQRTGEDTTRPGVAFQPGAFHPITLVRNEIVRILERMGFAVAEGPEME
ncbi:MAG: phenylalanine--tRNA ligase subunit alpha, partial [Schleiferiaceae bacterium]|nr:phenylalanine--tRNA ligase subunit alpha [Schleiferiaceae bacterium]